MHTRKCDAGLAIMNQVTASIVAIYLFSYQLLPYNLFPNNYCIGCLCVIVSIGSIALTKLIGQKTNWTNIYFGKHLTKAGNSTGVPSVMVLL